MTSTSQPNQELTHVRADGSAHMVDVTEKSVTTRTALAEATVRTREDVIAMIFDADLPKGDALPVARVAGIMGAKRTPEIIPLCHPATPWARLRWTLSAAPTSCVLRLP